ncbi:MAG: hypothetical protein V4555_10875 [Acidobacteriota bacterium]
MSKHRNPMEQFDLSSSEELEALLLEAVESGEPLEMTPTEWQRLRDDVEQDAVARRRTS